MGGAHSGARRAGLDAAAGKALMPCPSPRGRRRVLQKDLCPRPFLERAPAREGDTEYDLISTNKLSVTGPLLPG